MTTTENTTQATTPDTEDTELEAFAGRFLQLWNEPDADARRTTVEALWAPSGANYTPAIEAVGHDEIVARVTRSFDRWVGGGTHRFRQGVPPAAHHNAVKVQWEMVEVASGEVASVGLELLILDDNDQIVTDHQFVLS